MGRTRRAGKTAAGGRGLILAAVACAFSSGIGTVAAQEAPAAPEPVTTCAKAEFESAVDEAAEALRDLNNRNRPEFQSKLRDLKDKRGWNNDQFLKEAAPYVMDEEIAVFDARSNELLASISSMGTEGASAKEPNCAVLAELRRLMQVLIETQSAKWAYMFKKLDAVLSGE